MRTTPMSIAAALAIAAVACTTESELTTRRPEEPPVVQDATPTSALPSQTPASSVEPTATISLPPVHRIGIRAVNGVGEFFDRETNAVFIPRGVNYIHVAPQRLASGELVQRHATFDTDLYRSSQTEALFDRMQQFGFNVVRVFLEDSLHGLVGPGTELNDEYVDNIADFLRLAKENEIYVWLTIDWLPSGKYGEILNRGCCDFTNRNLMFLTQGGIEAQVALYADLSRELWERGAPVENIFAYAPQNELYFVGSAPPLSRLSGEVTAANGITYDMGSPDDRQQMMDEGLVYFIDSVREGIREIDPSALVTVGFFAPQGPVPYRLGDERLIETAPAIWQSTADFIDLHPYAGLDLSLSQYARNFGIAGMDQKPIVMGEFGAFRSGFPSLSQGIRALVQWQQESCDHGFDGWVLWRWRTSTDDVLWNALDGGGAVGYALSSTSRPDPCAPVDLADVPVLALPTETPIPLTGARGEVVLRSSISCPQPVMSSGDRIVLRTAWGAGSDAEADEVSEHMSFEVTLDGAKLDVESAVYPVQGSGTDVYGCGQERGVYRVYWDIPIGNLSSGSHTVTVQYVLLEDILDGDELISSGILGSIETAFTVAP